MGCGTVGAGPDLHDRVRGSRGWRLALSANAIDVLKRRLKGDFVVHEASGKSKGEWQDFLEVSR